MENIKLLDNNANELENRRQIIIIYSQDIGMRFGREK